MKDQTFFRISSSTISTVRQNSTPSDADFCMVGGSRLVVRIGNEDGEPPETRTYRSIDSTHWEDENGGCLGIWHSQQMSEWLASLGRPTGRFPSANLLGIAVEDENGHCIFSIGNPYR